MSIFMPRRLTFAAAPEQPVIEGKFLNPWPIRTEMTLERCRELSAKSFMALIRPGYSELFEARVQ